MSKKWFVLKSDKRYGPFTKTQIERLLEMTKINADTDLLALNEKRHVTTVGQLLNCQAAGAMIQDEATAVGVRSTSSAYILAWLASISAMAFIGAIIFTRYYFAQQTPEVRIAAIPSAEIVTPHVEDTNSFPRPTPPSIPILADLELPAWLEDSLPPPPEIEFEYVQESIPKTWSGIQFEYPYFKVYTLSFDSNQDGAVTVLEPAMASKSKYREFSPRLAGRFKFELNKRTGETEILLDQLVDLKNGSSLQFAMLLKGLMTNSPNAICGSVSRSRFKRSNTPVFNEARDERYGFVLLPGSNGQNFVALATRLNNLKQRVDEANRNGLIPTMADAGLLPTICEWASMLEQEGKGDSLKKTMEIGHRDTANLFADKYFVPFFGMPFDDISTQQSLQLYWLMSTARRGKLGPVATAAVADLGMLEHHFRVGGSQGRLATLGYLWPRRVLRKWKAEAEASISNHEPGIGLGQHARQLESVWKRFSTQLFPSEQDFDSAVALDRERAFLAEIGIEIVSNRVKKLVLAENNDPTNRSDYSTIRNWKTGVFKDLDMNGFRGEIVNEVEAVLDDLRRRRIVHCAKQFLHEIESVPLEIESIDRLAMIAKQVQQCRDQTAVGGDKLFQSIREYCLKLRGWVACRNIKALLQHVADQNSVDQITHLETRWNEPPLRTPQSVSKRLFDALRERRSAIEYEKWAAFYSIYELSLMDQDRKVVVETQVRPPTTEEIRLAYLRAHAPLRGEMTTPHTYESTIYIVSIVSSPAWTLERVEDARILSAIPLTSGKGYEVRFQLKHQIELFSPLLPESPLAIFDQMQAITGARWTEERVGEFVLTERGWESPTVQTEYSTLDSVVAGQTFRRMGLEFEKTLPIEWRTRPDLIKLFELRRSSLQRRLR